MKKSGSITNIPVRLFGPSTSGKPVANRDSSKTRLSHQDSSALPKPVRAASLDRKSQPNVKQTPLNRQRSFQRVTPVTKTSSSSTLSKPLIRASNDRRSQTNVKQTPLNRQRSLQRSTPASLRTNSSSKPAASITSALKERKTIQKLSTNKNWVNAQYEKVKMFISTSELIDPTIIKPNNIKPPSIKVFVYFVTVMLTDIFPCAKITMDNYKEEIIKKFKAMRYPGSVTNSLLKTVNTMHSWPQVIGMFGWLIDKVQLTNNHKIDYSALPEGEKQQHALTQLCTDYILERYVHFNATQDEPPEEVEKIDDDFATAFAKILGLDVISYQQLAAEVEEKEKYLCTIKSEVEELSEINKNLEEKKNCLIEDMETRQQHDAAEDAALEAEVEHYSKLVPKVTERENELIANILILEQSAKSQPCTYQEKKDILQNIKNLENEVNIIKEKIKHDQDIKSSLDVEINEEHEKLQSKVIEWNRSLRTVCIKKPDFKALLFKETGLHREEFMNEIKEVAKMKVEIENDVMRKIESTEIRIKQLNDEINSMMKELGVIQSDIHYMVDVTNQLCKQTAVLDKDSKEQLASWEQQSQKLLSDLRDFEERKELETAEQENNELTQKRNELSDSFNKFKITSVKFFLQVNALVNSNIQEIAKVLEGVRNQVVQAGLKAVGNGDELDAFVQRLRNEQ